MNNLQDPLQNRKSYIGASDAPIVMGVNPWTTKYDLWLEKLGRGKPNIDNYQKAQGRYREEEARNEFEIQTGLTMFPRVFYTKECDFVRASLDGIDLEEKNIVEIKCPGKTDHEMAMDGVVPEKYIPQLQHQLFVTGLDQVNYFSYTPVSNKIIQVYRDQNYIDHMFEEHCKFWDLVKKEKPPELCERDYVIKDDDFWLEVERKWKLTKNELKALEEKEKSLRDTLISMCSNSNCRGRLLQITKCVRKGNVNYLKIPQYKDVDFELYRENPTEYWKIVDVK